jgi:hypothetical protein
VAVNESAKILSKYRGHPAAAAYIGDLGTIYNITIVLELSAQISALSRLDAL